MRTESSIVSYLEFRGAHVPRVAISARGRKLGFEPDSAGELPACRAFAGRRHAGSVSAETGKDAYPSQLA
jgi:hypothetical protein